MSSQQKIFERACTDAEFRQRLQANPKAVLRESGVNLAPGATVELIEVNPNEIHLNLGRSDSAPMFRSILDRADQDAAYRQQLLLDPKAVINQALSGAIPDNTTVRVHDRPRAGTVRFFLPPLHSPASGELSDADLEGVAGGGFFKNVMSGLKEWICKDTHAVEINDQNNSYQIMTDTSHKAPTNEVGSLVVW
jgi:hypothetical protein